jgi:L-threonylcarbamoyladenylate synthase
VLEVNVENAVELLEDGKLIAYPTEAVFGIGCCPNNLQACIKLRQFKERNTKGFIIVASSFTQIVNWVNWAKLSKLEVMRIKHSWPGATTWVLPASKMAMPLILGPKNTIAIRVSSHRAIIDLCNAFGGPIVSTSANLPGKTPARCVGELQELYENKIISGHLEGEIGKSSKPSQVIDALTNTLLRA